MKKLFSMWHISILITQCESWDHFRFLVTVVQSLSRAQLLVTLMDCSTLASLSFTISWSLLELMSIESVMPSNNLVLCLPLLLQYLIFPNIRVFSNESALCIRWPEYWSFSFSISPSNKYSGLITFMIDWLDLLAVQGTFKSLLQSQASSTFQKHQFFSAQPSLWSITHIHTWLLRKP